MKIEVTANDYQNCGAPAEVRVWNVFGVSGVHGGIVWCLQGGVGRREEVEGCLGRECKGVWEATCQRKRCDTRMLPLPLDGLLPNRLFPPLPFPITLLYLPSLINAPSHLHLSHLSYYIDLETSLASHRPTIEASLGNFSN